MIKTDLIFGEGLRRIFAMKNPIVLTNKIYLNQNWSKRISFKCGAKALDLACEAIMVLFHS